MFRETLSHQLRMLGLAVLFGISIVGPFWLTVEVIEVISRKNWTYVQGSLHPAVVGIWADRSTVVLYGYDLHGVKGAWKKFFTSAVPSMLLQLIVFVLAVVLFTPWSRLIMLISRISTAWLAEFLTILYLCEGKTLGEYVSEQKGNPIPSGLQGPKYYIVIYCTASFLQYGNARLPQILISFIVIPLIQLFFIYIHEWVESSICMLSF
ncbi:hypothetical protein BC829DRAFT_414838 [Chytridium lagenaria]|nr:hypothetical protein BC829DRAFT_414838 [Chytridium lagenaria]